MCLMWIKKKVRWLFVRKQMFHTIWGFSSQFGWCEIIRSVFITLDWDEGDLMLKRPFRENTSGQIFCGNISANLHHMSKIIAQLRLSIISFLINVTANWQFLQSRLTIWSLQNITCECWLFFIACRYRVMEIVLIFLCNLLHLKFFFDPFRIGIFNIQSFNRAAPINRILINLFISNLLFAVHCTVHNYHFPLPIRQCPKG